MKSLEALIDLLGCISRAALPARRIMAAIGMRTVRREWDFIGLLLLTLLPLVGGLTPFSRDGAGVLTDGVADKSAYHGWIDALRVTIGVGVILVGCLGFVSEFGDSTANRALLRYVPLNVIRGQRDSRCARWSVTVLITGYALRAWAMGVGSSVCVAVAHSVSVVRTGTMVFREGVSSLPGSGLGNLEWLVSSLGLSGLLSAAHPTEDGVARLLLSTASFAQWLMILFLAGGFFALVNRVYRNQDAGPIDIRAARATRARKRAHQKLQIDPRRYNRNAKPQRVLAQRVADSLPKGLANESIGTVLELGAGTGFLTDHVIAAGVDQVVAVEINGAMAEWLRAHVSASTHGDRTEVVETAAEDFLGLPGPKFDAVVSSAYAQWTESPDDLMRQVLDRLSPGGVFAIGVYGKETLQELRSGYADFFSQQLTESVRLVDGTEWQRRAEQAGARNVEVAMENECRHVNYHSLGHLLSAVRAMGASYSARGDTSRIDWATFLDFERFLLSRSEEPGRIKATWDGLVVFGRKGS